jgi:hypothetical protein
MTASAASSFRAYDFRDTAGTHMRLFNRAADSHRYDSEHSASPTGQ